MIIHLHRHKGTDWSDMRNAITRRAQEKLEPEVFRRWVESGLLTCELLWNNDVDLYHTHVDNFQSFFVGLIEQKVLRLRDDKKALVGNNATWARMMSRDFGVKIGHYLGLKKQITGYARISRPKDQK